MRNTLAAVGLALFPMAALGAQPVQICDTAKCATISQQAMASSIPVAIASDQSAVSVSQSAGPNPCQNPAATLTSVFGSTSGTTAVQIVALSGTTKVYICSLTVVGVSGTTPTFSLVYGTGVNCGTGQAVVLGAWTTAANTVYAFANPVAVVPAGQAVCYLDTGTTPVQRYTLTYVQQ